MHNGIECLYLWSHFKINSMKTILSILTVSRTGCRKVMHTSYVTSDLNAFRTEILERNPDLERVFFTYEEKEVE